MTSTLKDDFIAFFEHLTHTSPAHKAATERAIAKIKSRDIKDTHKDRVACADTLLRFCAGQFGGVKPTLTKDDWKRIRHLEKNHYEPKGHDLSKRNKSR